MLEEVSFSGNVVLFKKVMSLDDETISNVGSIDWDDASDDMGVGSMTALTFEGVSVRPAAERV